MTKKVVLITGASSGIGLATAELLHQAGYKVYGSSRSVANYKNITNFQMIELDVTSDSSVSQAVQEVIAQAGRIDVLVNNAGFALEPAAAEESSIAQAQAIFNTNFFGVVRMTNAVLPYMRKEGSGQIINIGSVLGFLPMPFGALYAATKHAIEGYSESLDHEVRTQGIRVSVIEPAYTNTPLESNLLAADSKLPEYQHIRSTLLAHMKKTLKNAESPQVVASTVLAAISGNRPQLRYTAGQLAGRLKLLRRFAPAAIMDKGIRKDLHI